MRTTPARLFLSFSTLLTILSLSCTLPVSRFWNPSSTVPPTDALPPTATPFQPAPIDTQPPPPTPLPVLPSETLPAPTAAPPPLIPYQPVFEPAPCPNSTASGYTVDCGYLLVPEDRTREGSPTLRLAVNIYRSYSSAPMPDPVIHLAGGPGSSSLDTSIYMLRSGFDSILAARDLIFFDQRGTGYSQPRLDCPEREAAAPTLLEGNILPDQSQPLVLDAFSHCRARLQGQGIDLSMYNSAASAADIADLRLALGLEQVNLYGDSYGTRLALTVMRDHPAGIRSVILDSVYPPESNLYTWLPRNADRAFRVFFDRCAAEPSCSSSHPDLENFFYSLVDRLNANPVELTASGYPITLTGDLLIDVLFVGLYNNTVMARMPAMIYQVEEGDYSILRERLSLYFDTGSALGMQMSVQCREEIPFGSLDDLTALSAGINPQVASAFGKTIPSLLAVCDIWGVPPASQLENQPVSSDIPSLVLAGGVDPITPPEWGRQAAQALSHSVYYEFPGSGHWVARNDRCAIELIRLFLDDPASPPQPACLP